MILSQEHKKKHYFFLSKRIVVCFLISITLTNAYAQTQRGRKDDAKAEEISFKDRWGIKTNAVDWLLTIPILVWSSTWAIPSETSVQSAPT